MIPNLRGWVLIKEKLKLMSNESPGKRSLINFFESRTVHESTVYPVHGW